MKRLFSLFCVICLLFAGELYAQDHIVQGRVLSQEDGTPFTRGEIIVYFFASEGEAQTIKNKLIDNPQYWDAKLLKEYPDDSGLYYCDEAYVDGWILVFNVNSKNWQIKSIDGKSDIDFKLSSSKSLINVYVDGKFRGGERPDAPEPPKGEILSFRPQFEGRGDEHGRIIYRPYVKSCYQVPSDTIIEYYKPIVVEGKKFAMTQERRMGYDAKRDSLYKYVKDTLFKSRIIQLRDPNNPNVQKKDTIQDTIFLSLKDNKSLRFSLDYNFRMPDTKAYYQLWYSRVTQEYTGITEYLDTMVCSCQREDPLQYFQYSFDSYPLDPDQYKPSSRLRARNDADTVSLTFLVGRTQLDPANPKNETEWEKIVTRLEEINKMKGARIQSFEIVGVSSPEGGYQSNLDLARRRAAYALNSLTQQGLLQRRTATTSHGEVAGWDKVADLMEANYPDKAAELREIIANHETIDAQSGKIRVLPYYQLIKDSILPQLRCVRTSCKYIIHRNLTSTEILDIYKSDSTFQFEPLEYWTLIQKLDDPKAKAQICKRALNEIGYSRRLRLFAANELARAYMDMGVVDTAFLPRYYDLSKYKVNQMSINYDGETPDTTIYNPSEMIANQVCMLIRGNKYIDALDTVQYLKPLPQYSDLVQLVSCLNGFYATDPAVLNANLGKDLVNTIVLHLAMGARVNENFVDAATRNYHNFQALKLIRQLNDLPAEQQALGYYLKAVIYNRLGNFLANESAYPNPPSYYGAFLDKSEDCLLKCFELDETFIKRCQGDAYIRDKYEGTGDNLLYDNAVDRYYKWKDGAGELTYTVLDDMVDEYGLSAPDPSLEDLVEWGLINE